MTALSPETAIAILASHGADPARWPAEDRAALLALAQSDPAVAAALAEARTLDAALTDWVAAPAPMAGIDIAAITRLPQQRAQPAPRASGWRPALLAASVALVAAVGGWFGMADQYIAQPQMQIATASPPSAEVAAGEADLAFAYVFTPTAAEEDLI